MSDVDKFEELTDFIEELQSENMPELDPDSDLVWGNPDAEGGSYE